MEDIADKALASGEGRSNLLPRLLMKLLGEEIAPDALWWLPDGKAFAIDPDKISPEVLEKFFRGTKYSSFIRRLHNAGFRRRTRFYRKVPGLKLPEKVVVLSHDCFLKDKPELLERFNEEPEEPAISQLEEARSNFLQNRAGDRLRAFERLEQLEQPSQTTATALSYPLMPGDVQSTMFQRALQTSQSLCAPMESLPLTSTLSAGQDCRLLSNLTSQLLFARQQGGPFISQDLLLLLQHQQMPGNNSNLIQCFLLESLVQQQQQQHNLQRLQEFAVHQSLVASGQQSRQRNASITDGDDSL